MITDRKSNVQFISRDAMSILFRRSESYHRRKMRELFRAHYCPDCRDDLWLRHLSVAVTNQFRLHLSWDLGIAVFDWPLAEVGIRILSRYKQQGIYKFLNSVIRVDRESL